MGRRGLHAFRNKQGPESYVMQEFYGAHSWHLDKCKSGLISDLNLEESDDLILHFWNPNWDSKPPIKGKLIYSCHEKDVRPIKSFKAALKYPFKNLLVPLLKRKYARFFDGLLRSNLHDLSEEERHRRLWLRFALQTPQPWPFTGVRNINERS